MSTIIHVSSLMLTVITFNVKKCIAKLLNLDLTNVKTQHTLL